DDIYYNVIWNNDQKVLALMDNNIDIIGDMIDPAFLGALMSSPEIGIETTPRNGYGLYTLNCQKYPLNISSFRRAIAFALDKERISSELWDGFSTPQDSVVPSINQFSIEDQLSFHYYDANVARGNQLLDDAGFLDVDSDGFREAPDGSDFQIKVETSQGHPVAVGAGDIMAEALQTLGIDGVCEPTDFWIYLDAVQNHRDFDIVFFGTNFIDYGVQWLATDYGSDYVDVPGFNYPMFENDTYDSWINQLLHSGNYEDVYDAAIEMQRIIAYECPTIIAYNNLYISAYRTDMFEGFVNDFSEGVHSWWTNQKVHLQDGQGGPYGGTLRWFLPQDAGTSNVMLSTNVYDNYIFEALYDSLLKVDPNGFFVPWLAESHYVENHWDNPDVLDGQTRKRLY
ncbi:MAG: ABC transporter substrate-binding protein, partial [Candidatus Thorarchaeota archaeon]|nr:ABC transporter substrate-binding protein [Candidatus Thorarchaeota archaeon]